MSEAAFCPSGGHLITIQFELGKLSRPEVRVEPSIVYTVLGEDHGFGKDPAAQFKATGEDRAIYAKWCILSYDLFETGKIKASMILSILSSAYRIRTAIAS